jgi:hypothetical protein
MRTKIFLQLQSKSMSAPSKMTNPNDFAGRLARRHIRSHLSSFSGAFNRE